ncbi:MAG: radical SAM protein [Candidatus Methanosuratus sp.]|nr:radical SAM protein [Candidatus Methanosuratincola sp.]
MSNGSSNRENSQGEGGMEAVYAPEVVPLSLCDYPGEPAIVIFFSGCNYRCGYCQNWRIRDQKQANLTDLARLERFLEGGKLVTACKVTGGEPLLQLGALTRIAKKAKSLGYKFGIDTNGAFPDRLSVLLPMLDLVSIDVKTALDDVEYRKVTGVENPVVSRVVESIKISLASRAFVDLRMVVIPGINDNPEVIRSISRDLIGMGYVEKASAGSASFTLVEFVPENSSGEYRGLQNPSVGDLVRLARMMSLRNVRVSHRALGYCVSLDRVHPDHGHGDPSD